MPAVFLDRDGVIIKKAPEGAYISHWDRVRFLPGSVKAIGRLHQAGFKVFIVTNQRGLALHKVRLEHLEEIHRRIQAKLADQGVTVSGIYFCPHAKSKKCACRKPQPGMLLQAAADHALDLRRAWLVGDAPSDIEAGKRAGCKTVWIRKHYRNKSEIAPDFIAPDLLSAANHILQASGDHAYLGTDNKIVHTGRVSGREQRILRSSSSQCFKV